MFWDISAISPDPQNFHTRGGDGNQDNEPQTQDRDNLPYTGESSLGPALGSECFMPYLT